MYWLKNKKTGEITEVTKAVAKPLLKSGNYVEVDPNANPEPVVLATEFLPEPEVPVVKKPAKK